MTSSRGLLIGVLAVAPIVIAAEPATKSAAKLSPAAKGTIDFTRDIEPIIKQHCLKCHNEDKARGGLRLDDGKEALVGGNGGAVIVPGKSAESKLLLAVAGGDAEIK